MREAESFSARSTEVIGRRSRIAYLVDLPKNTLDIEPNNKTSSSKLVDIVGV